MHPQQASPARPQGTPGSESTERRAVPRHYLMCRPTHFAVEYAINPWMRPDEPVDVERAITQWETLRHTYAALGHRVDLIEPVDGLPDMVFAANGAVVVDGLGYGSRFRYPERQAEAGAYLDWLAANMADRVVEPSTTAEGEGDFLVAGERILAGTGFRTDKAAHDELAEVTGRPVVSLELIDPRYYHLDTALAVLTDDLVAYLPEAFSMGSRELLRRLFPDAILADAADAEVFGLNAVSDGLHVVLPIQATGLTEQLAARGFEPVPVDLSEFKKAGGGPKCCTLELRPSARGGGRGQGGSEEAEGTTRGELRPSSRVGDAS